MNMKENDWVIANINNPEMNAGDFRVAGMDMDNTQMLSKDQYLQSDYIKNNPMFQDEQGDFQQSKFDDFYNVALQKYQTFSSIGDGFQYDMFDYRRYQENNAQVKNPELQIVRVSNPDEQTIGDGWINDINESPLSYRELAEKSRIYDTESGQFVDYSPNDHALLQNPIEWAKDIFKDPLVLAVWDEDGEHEDPVTGEIKQHVKGDRKLDENGKYYYETLNGRSLAGKEVLSGFDTLTVDGTALNKIDFFDSDDKEKSIGGTIMKSAAAIAPMFMGPVGTAYSVVQVLREFGKVLPFIEGLTHIATGNTPDTAFSKFANNIAGKMMAATSSQDDYSQQHQLSLGNLATLATDVALQWGQQKVIASAFQKLRNSKKLVESAEKSAFEKWKIEQPKLITEARNQGISEKDIMTLYGTAAKWKQSNLGQSILNKAMQDVTPQMDKINRLGADMSLVYMALVSNPDVYTTMQEHGCTKRESALVTLGSTLAMFGVDKYLGLGEMFFDDLTNDGIKSIRATLNKERATWAKTLAEGVKMESKDAKGMRRILGKSINSFNKVYTDFFDNLKNHSLGALGKAVGEGLEEVSEEVATDLSKQLYELAASWDVTDKFFGDLTTDNVGAFDDAFNNPDWLKQMLARYGMNFLGGFMGGGIFYAKERFTRKDWKRDTSNDDLIHNVRQYGKNEVMKVLDNYHKNGKLGSTKLSARTEFVEGSDQPVFLSAEADDGRSQNDVVYDLLRKEIDSIDSIVNDSTVLKSDHALMQSMTLGDFRLMHMNDMLEGDYSKGLQSRYTDLATAYTKVKLQQQKIQQEIQSADSNIELRKQKENILEQLQEREQTLKERMEEMYSGDNAVDYMGKVLFNIDQRFQKIFSVPNFRAWLNCVHVNQSGEYVFNPITDKQYDALSRAEQDALYKEYTEWKANNKGTDQKQAWSAFKYIRDIISPEFTNIQDRLLEYSKQMEEVEQLFDKDKSPLMAKNIKEYKPEEFSLDAEDPMFKIDYDTQLRNEPPEIYAFRNEKFDGESDEDFEARKQRRIQLLQKQYAIRRSQEAQLTALKKARDILATSGGLIDAPTRRRLKLILNSSDTEIVDTIRDSYNWANTSRLTGQYIAKKIKDIKTDLSNFDEILADIQEKVKTDLFKDTSKKILDAAKIHAAISIRFGKLFGSGLPYFDDPYLEYTEDLFKKEPNLIKVLHDELVIREIFNKYQEQNEKIKDFFSEYITDGELDEKGLIEYLTKDLPIANTGALSSEQKEKLKAELKAKGWSDEDLAKINRISSLEPSQIQEVSDALKSLGYNAATVINLKSLTQYQYKHILKQLYKIKGEDAFNEINQDKDILNEDVFNIDRVKIAAYDFVQKSPSGEYNSDIKLKTKSDGNIDYSYYLTLLNELFKIRNHKFTLSDVKRLIKPNASGFLDISNLMYNLNFVNGINLRDAVLDPDTLGLNWEPSESDIYKLEGFKTTLNASAKHVGKFINMFKDEVKHDPVYDYIQELKKMRVIDNPIIDIIKKLGLATNSNVQNIEQLFEKIDRAREENGYQSFTLSDPELEALDDAKRLLNMTLSFVFAASRGTTLSNPFPHNELLNNLTEKYGITKQVFPVLDPDVVQVYVKQINNLLQMIGEPDENGEYPANTLMWWNIKNQYNKSKMFVNARDQNIKAKLQIFALMRSGTDLFADTEGEFNLLPKYDSIVHSDHTDAEKLALIEQDFYESTQALLAQHKDWTIKDILNRTSIKNLFEGKAAQYQLEEQSTSQLTDKVEYGQLTSMDKAMYLMTILNVSSDNYNKFLADFCEKHKDKAALDIQQHVSRQTIAYMQNPKQWQEMLEWLYDAVDDVGKGSIMYAMFLTGNGGAGKTSVCVQQNIDYAKVVMGYTDEQIVLSGPTKSQIDNLSSLKGGKTKSINEILDGLIGADVNKSLHEELTDKSKWKRIVNERSPIIDPAQKIDFKDTKTKVIIIDEATWIPLFDISILSKWAKDTGGTLILVGDNFQQGILDKNNDYNNISDSSIAFCGRTSRLGITLRDCNIQKYNNTIDMVKYMNGLLYIDHKDPNVEILYGNAIKNFMENFHLNYFDGDVINGDYITPELTDEILGKIDTNTSIGAVQKKEKIAYLGTNEDTLKRLKAKFGEANVVHFVNEQEIQGQEFSNIIIDTDIALTKAESNADSAHWLYLWLQRVYTLSTRGKNAAIFIDPNKKMSFVKNIKDKFKNNKSNFNAEAVEKLNKSMIDFLTSIKASEKTYDKPVKTPVKPYTYKTPKKRGAFGRASVSVSEEPEVDDDIMSPEYASEEDERTTGGIYLNRELGKRIETTESWREWTRFSVASTETTMDDELKACPDLDSAMVYTEGTLTGMPISVETKKATSKSGKEFDKKYRTYTFEDADTLYDGAIFAALNGKTSGETFEYDKNIFNPLIQLKRCFMYKLSWENANHLFGEQLDKIISQEQYEEFIGNKPSKRMALEISEYDDARDHFIGLSHLSDSEDAMSIATVKTRDGEKKLTFKLVLSWDAPGSTAEKPKTYKITLGLFNNPQTYESNRETIIKKITKHLKRPNLSEESRVRSEIFRKRINTDGEGYDSEKDPIESYKAQIQKYAEDFAQAYNNATSDVDTDGYDKNSKTLSIQLGTKPNQILPTIIRTSIRNHKGTVPTLKLSEFKKKYPDLTVSQVYIYRPPSAESEDIPMSAGKACVFVTKDPTLSADQLLNVWAGEGPGRVKLIKLDNIGVTISQLCQRQARREFVYGKYIKSEKNNDHNIFPFVSDRMAVRWFSSLWNWRADIISFKNKIVEAFKDPEIFDIDALKKIGCTNYGQLIESDIFRDILNDMHKAYQKYQEEAGDNASEAEFRKKYEPEYTHKLLTKEDIKSIAQAIFKFNDSLDTQCRRFRLGIGNVTGNIEGKEQNEWQIRRIYAKEDDPFYGRRVRKGETIYGIYLTPQLLNKYIEITDEIFGFIRDGLGITAKEKDGKTGSYVEVSKTKRLDTRRRADGSVINAIWNQNGNEPFRISGPDSAATDMSHIRLKALPAVIVRMMSRAMAYEKVVEVTDEKGQKKLILPASNEEYEGRKKKLGRDLEWRWAQQGFLFIPQYEKQGEKYVLLEREKQNQRRTIRSIVEQGYNVATMLELCFHGSTENVVEARLNSTQHKYDEETGKQLSGQPIPQATDSEARYGWFSDPFVAQSARGNDRNNSTTISSRFVPTTTPDILFGVTAQIDSPAMRIYWNSEDISTEETVEEESNHAVVEGKGETLYDILTSKETTPSDKTEKVKNIIDQRTQMYFELLDAFRQVSGNEGFNFDNADVVQGDNNIIVNMLNGDSYKIIASDNTVKVEKITKPTNTETVETTEINTEVLESKKAQLKPIFTEGLFGKLNDGFDSENLDLIAGIDPSIEDILGEVDEVQHGYIKEFFRTLKSVKTKYNEFAGTTDQESAKEKLREINDELSNINKNLNENSDEDTREIQSDIRLGILSLISEGFTDDVEIGDDQSQTLANAVEKLREQINEDTSCKLN